MKSFILSLAADVVLFGAFYLWQFRGSHDAGTFFVFVAWTFTGFLVIGLFGEASKRRRNSFRLTWGCLVAILFVSAALWVGLTALSITYFIAWMLFQSKNLGPERA